MFQGKVATLTRGQICTKRQVCMEGNFCTRVKKIKYIIKKEGKKKKKTSYRTRLRVNSDSKTIDKKN